MDGVSVRAVCDEAWRSAPDPETAKNRRNTVAGTLEQIRKYSVSSSIADPETGIHSSCAFVDDDLSVTFYWAVHGRFLILVKWRRRRDDERSEARQHRRALIASKTRLEKFLDENGGEINA